MRNRKSLLTALVLTGALALSALPAAASGILFKSQIAGTNYCHLRYPAITLDSLFTDNPVLAPATSSDVVDFYGSCDHDPLGQEEVRQQRLDYERDRFDGDNG